MGPILLVAAFLALVAITALGCWWLEHSAPRTDELAICLRRDAKGAGKNESSRPRVRPRPLSEEDRRGFIAAWGSVRDHFEDDPNTAVVYADVLVAALMRQRGMTDDSSGRLQDQYRLAHEIATHQAPRPLVRDDLGRALGLYAVLFHELLPSAPAPGGEEERTSRGRGPAENRVGPPGLLSHRHSREHYQRR
jgi:hypothetical protein